MIDKCEKKSGNGEMGEKGENCKTLGRTKTVGKNGENRDMVKQ
jgi:hypothetical protein